LEKLLFVNISDMLCVFSNVDCPIITICEYFSSVGYHFTDR